jgi:hypothetical protein
MQTHLSAWKLQVSFVFWPCSEVCGGCVARNSTVVPLQGKAIEYALREAVRCRVIGWI